MFEVRKKLDEIMKVACDELERSQRGYKRYFDKRSKKRRYAVPFRVTKIDAINFYEVEVQGKKKDLHANLLKRCRLRSETDGKICKRTMEGSW